MAQKAAETGVGPATVVAIEQHFPEGARIIDDDLASQMLPFGARAYVWLSRCSWVRDMTVRAAETKTPGVWAMALCRKRYIADKVLEAVPDPAEGVVNLGAGFDTLACRLPALARVPVWEVDQPGNIDAKRSRLNELFGKVPPHLTLVRIDFDSQDLAATLASHNCPLDARAFFILEGVTQYLTEAGIRETFGFLAGAPAGSRLVFTYVRKDFVDGKALYGHEFLYRKMLTRDKVWLFGIEPEDIADFLGGYGWRVLEHFGYEELAEIYVRPTGRQLDSMALERVVHAEKL